MRSDVTLAPKLLSVAQAAQRLGLSYHTMLGEIHAGQIPALRLGTGYYKLHPDEVARYAKRVHLVVETSA